MILMFLGILTGYLIGKYLLGVNNTIYHGPDSNDIKKQIFYCPKRKKYYKFTPKPYVCPPMYANASKQMFLRQKTIQQQE